MTKKYIKGILSRKKNHDEEVFVIIRGKHYTIPGRLIDEEGFDESLRKRALNDAYKPFGFEIKSLGDVYTSRIVSTLDYPEVEEIYHEINDWKKIRTKKREKANLRKIKWVPSQEIYDILDAF